MGLGEDDIAGEDKDLTLGVPDPVVVRPLEVADKDALGVARLKLVHLAMKTVPSVSTKAMEPLERERATRPDLLWEASPDSRRWGPVARERGKRDSLSPEG